MTKQTRRKPFEATKSPGADLPYGLNWTKWLASGDDIVTSSWAISPAGELSSDQDGVDTDGKITTVWLQGGVAGNTYLVTNSIVTTLGHEDDRSIRVHVLDR